MSAMQIDDIPDQYNVVNILERNLPAHADKTALFSYERNLTFQEVSAEVNQVGNALKELGVNFGEHVGILCLDQPAWVTSFFGIGKIGATAVSLNTLLTTNDFKFILHDSRVRVLIIHGSLLGKIEPIRDELPFLDHVIVIGESEHTRDEDRQFFDWIDDKSTNLKAAPTHQEDFCSLNYSSGTTGMPKGIPHSPKDYVLQADRWGKETLGLEESDRTFAVAKLFFTFGMGGTLIFPWYVGASTVLFSGPPRVATNVLEVIEKFEPTIFYNAPTSYSAILEQDDFPQDWDISSLRLCVSAGEALPGPLWERWKETTGLDIIDGIGTTENYHIFISNRPGDIKAGSSGKIVEGYDVKIVDPDGEPVEQGEIGDLLLKTDTVAPFYWHQYEASQRAMRGEWFFTGDKYYQDEDGYYFHAGRSDDMMKVGGIWVSPVEVESTLISHDAVQECAVVEKRDQTDLVKPKAYVILSADYQPSDELEEELIEYTRSEIADYKRPRWVEFRDELPKTATEKIQRYKLREDES